MESRTERARLIVVIAMIAVAFGAAWFVLVGLLSVGGVYENNQDQDDAGLYLNAGLVGLIASVAVIAGLCRRSRALTVVAALVQAAAVVWVLLLGATSVQGFGDEDRRFVLILVGLLVADTASIVIARKGTADPARRS